MGEGARPGVPAQSLQPSPPPRRSRWVVPLVVGLAVVLVIVGALIGWRVLTRPGTVTPVSAMACVTGHIDRQFYSLTVPPGWCHDEQGSGGVSLTSGKGSSIAVIEPGAPVDANKLCEMSASGLGTPTRLSDTQWGGQAAESYRLSRADLPDTYFYCVTVKGLFYALYGGTATGRLFTDAPDTFAIGVKALFASWEWK